LFHMLKKQVDTASFKEDKPPVTQLCTPSSSHNIKLKITSVTSATTTVDKESMKLPFVEDLQDFGAANVYKPFYSNNSMFPVNFGIVKVINLKVNSNNNPSTIKNEDSLDWLYSHDFLKNKNFYRCALPRNVLKNGKMCRWLLSQLGTCRSGLFCDFFIARNNCIDLINEFKQFLIDDDADDDDMTSLTSYKFTLQKWPSEKMAAKERTKIEVEEVWQEIGFSAAALQEMQHFYQLHHQISNVRGHSNFILPITVLFNTQSEASPPLNETPDLNNYMNILNEDSTKQAKKEETFLPSGSYLVYEPMPMVLHQVFSYLKKKKNETSTFSCLPLVLFDFWLYDLLSALEHCHKNHVVLRNLNTDQIFLDHWCC